MRIDLNGVWTLYCLPERDGKNPPAGIEPAAGDALFSLPCAVPGDVQDDLFRAGKEKDPYFGDNYYDYIRYESCGWLYETTFPCPDAAGEDAILRFDGIDTVADVFVNGRFAGRAEDMFVEHEFDVTALLRPGENRLRVHIFSAMNYVRGKSYPVTVFGSGDRNQIPYIRKAAHCFGWDIFPRLVTAGLWRGVFLYTRKKTRLTETYFAVSAVADDAATLRWAVRFAADTERIEDFEIAVEGVCGDRRFGFSVDPVFVTANGTLTVRDPALWWPAGYGDAALYAVTTTLKYRGVPVDAKTERIGLRHVRLERDFTPGQQKFRFFVNNVPVFCMGTNWVPTDALHARAKARQGRALALAKACGCNMMRVWGGGVYEDEDFFDFCDENGILVWQDFAMGNALYPQDGGTDAVLTDEAEKLIRRIRNHPSLCVYAGDNEIDSKYLNFDFPEAQSVYNRISRELLPRLVSRHDPYRQYLKSSPEIPFGFAADNVPEQHTWGARAYYKDDFYKNCAASFIGEAGYHGCPAPASIEKFIPAGSRYPFLNRYYAAHATADLRTEEGLDRLRMMTDQARMLCGETPGDLASFAEISQLAQAEALKFFVERARACKAFRGGILWWNLTDGWPQVSDAVTDYYFEKKTAFSFLTVSQRPVLAFLGEQAGWDLPLLIANDTRRAVTADCEVTDAFTGERLLAAARTAAAGETVTAGRFRMIPGEKRLLLIRYTVDGGAPAYNHYLTGYPPYGAALLSAAAALLRDLYRETDKT